MISRFHVFLAAGTIFTTSFILGPSLPELAAQDKAAKPATHTSWTMHRRDLKNRGQVEPRFDVTEGRTEWSFLLAEAVTVTPLCEDGILYLGDAGTRIYAIDLANRKRLWETKPRVGKMNVKNPAAEAARKSGDLVTETQGASTGQQLAYANPVIAKDRIVAITKQGLIFAVDKKTGAILWERELGVDIYSSLRFVDDKLLVGTLDSRYLAMDPKDGKTIWTYEAGDIIGCTPAISERSGKIYALSYDRCLHIIDLKTGKKIEVIKTGFRSNSSILFAEGCLFFTGSAREMVCFDLIEKKVRWRIASGPLTQHGFGYRNGKIFCHMSKYMYCINASDGSEVWKQFVEQGGAQSPALGDKLLYITNKNGKVFAFDIKSGEMKWSQPMAKGTVSPPVLMDGRLVTCDGRGKVHIWK